MADNMLIDGLIKFCDEKSKNIKLKAEPQVFIEIKQALEELKAIKSDKFSEYLLNMGYTKGITDGYNKAINEFANTLIPRLTDAIYPKDIESMTNLINDVARELKEGGKNE